MNATRLFRQLLALKVWGLCLFFSCLTAAEPAVHQRYYAIQLVSGEPEMINNAWQNGNALPYARIEKHAGLHMLRIGYWANKKQAVEQLYLVKKNFPGAYILRVKYEPNKIVRGWIEEAAKKPSNNTTAGRVEPSPLPSNLVLRQEITPPEVFVFKDRHEIWLEKPWIKPVRKPFFPSPPVAAEPVKKRKKMPDEAPLWQLYEAGNYVALQAEIIRNRNNYPYWHPPQKLLSLLLQGKISQTINRSIRGNDPAMLIYMAELYPDVFTCTRIDWAWALADARASQGHTVTLVLGLQRLIPDCNEQDRLATLYKATHWLATDQWEKLLEREAQADRSPQGENKFQKLRYQYQTKKLLTAYQSNDQVAFRVQLLQLDGEITRYRDVDTALLGGWHYYNAGETAVAGEWFTNALAWDPEQRDALAGLSYIAMQDKRFSDARYFANKLPARSEVRENILSSTNISTDLPSPTDTTSIVLAGTELNPGNSYAYAGTILPLSGFLGDGFMQRYWVERLTYSFNSNGRKIDAEQWGAEVLFGYRKPYSQGWWAAYAGPVYRNIQFSPNAANLSNRGGAFRGKIQLEGEYILSETWRVNAIASYVTGQHNYWVRGRLLYSTSNRFSVGPEIITLGDNNFQIVQFGWAILAAEVLPKTGAGIKFGARKAEGERATGYLGIELGRSF